MKRFLTLFAPLAMIVVVTMTTVTPASAWYCVAAGSTGARGWASNFWLNYAKHNALRQCARRTPFGYACYIIGCQ